MAPDSDAGGDIDLFDTADRRDPPAFDPRQFDAPSYETIEGDADLIAYSRAYLAVVISYYDLDVEASHIKTWEVSHRGKRQAAGVLTPDLEDLGAVVISGITKPDWEALQEEHADAVRRSRFDDLRDAHIRLTWDAYEAFDEAEWQETLRHEAVHIEQYHRYGTTGHGFDFKNRAYDLATTENCPQFVDYTYLFYCTECGEDAGGRYRECKAVEDARNEDGYFTSKCCEAPIGLRE